MGPERGLPNVNRPPPNLTLMVLGKAMTSVFWASANKPLQETLARLVREIEENEAGDGQSR